MQDAKIQLLEHIRIRQPHAYVPHLQRAFVKDALKRCRSSPFPLAKSSAWVQSQMEFYAAIKISETLKLVVRRDETDEEYVERLAATARPNLRTRQRRRYYQLSAVGLAVLEREETSH